MLQRTPGIVLRQIRYSDTSLVVKVYTADYGLIGLMARGVRSAKGRSKAALLQPPNILDLVLYYKEGRELHHFRELRPAFVYTRIPFEITRSTTAIFLTEVLGKCLKEQHPDPDIFQFLQRALVVLDTTDQGLGIFPHYFLFRLSQLMGFQPGHHPGGEAWFDLREGIYTTRHPGHPENLAPVEAELLAAMESMRFESLATPKEMRGSRHKLLQGLLDYFRLHVEGFGELRSPDILTEVLRG